MAIWAAKLNKHVRMSNIPLRVEPEVLVFIQLLLPVFRISDAKTFVEHEAGHRFCDLGAIEPPHARNV